MLVKLPKRMKFIYFWARTRMVQRGLMICLVTWICLLVYSSGIVEKYVVNPSLASNQVISPQPPGISNKINASLSNPTETPDLKFWNCTEQAAKDLPKNIDSHLKHQNLHLWESFSSQHWTAMFGYYNISLSGRFISILPPIHLSIAVDPNSAAELRNPNDVVVSKKSHWQFLSSGEVKDGADMDDLLSRDQHSTSPGEITIAILLAIPSLLFFVYLMVVLYRCMCSKHYAEWRTSWKSSSSGVDSGRASYSENTPDANLVMETFPLKLQGHTQELQYLHADDDIVVSSCLDGNINIWNSLSGECITSIRRAKSSERCRKPAHLRTNNSFSSDSTYSSSPRSDNGDQPTSPQRINDTPTFPKHFSFNNSSQYDFPDRSSPSQKYDFSRFTDDFKSENSLEDIVCHSAQVDQQDRNGLQAGLYKSGNRTEGQKRSSCQTDLSQCSQHANLESIHHTSDLSHSSHQADKKIIPSHQSDMSKSSHQANKQIVYSAPADLPKSGQQSDTHIRSSLRTDVQSNNSLQPRTNSESLYGNTHRTNIQYRNASDTSEQYRDSPDLEKGSCHNLHSDVLQRRNSIECMEQGIPCSSSTGDVQHRDSAQYMEKGTRVVNSSLTHQSIWSMDFFGSCVAVGCKEGRVEIWNAFSGQLEYAYEESSSGVVALCLTSDRLIVARVNGFLDFFVIHDVPAILPYHLQHIGHSDSHPSTSESIRCSLSQSVKAHSLTISALEVDGSYVISGGYDRLVKVFRCDSAVCIYTLHGHEGPISVLNIDQWSNCCATSGGQDGLLCEWDILTGTCMYNVKGHQAAVNQLFSTDIYLISQGADSLVCIWEKSQGHLLHSITQDFNLQSNLILLTNNIMVTTKEDNLILWDVNHGEALRMITVGSGDHSVHIKLLTLSGQSVVCDYGPHIFVINFPAISDKSE